MKILISLLSTTLLNLAAHSQGTLLKWHKDVKIEWSDFKGKVDKNSPFAAMSAVGIHYKYNSWGNGKVYKITFEIYSIFDKNRSWSKTGLRSPGMLKHEQLHFDIGALVSREFKKEAANRNYSKNYKNEIADIYNRYSKTLQKFQQKYDMQTNHGNDKT